MVGAADPCTDPPTPRAVAKVLELIGEGFVSVDAQWRFTYVNAQAERIYKKQRERLLGNNMWEMFPTALGTPFEREYRRAMAERVEGCVEAPFPRINAWVEVKIYPLEDGGLAFYFSDISQRRCADRHLACQKKLQELIFAGASFHSLLAVLAQTMESISVQPAQVSIMLIDPDSGALLHGAAPSLPAMFNDAVAAVPALVDAVPWAVAACSKRIVCVENIAEHPLACFRKLALAYGLRASWTTPIMAPQGAVLGTLSMFYRDCVRPAAMEEESALIFASLAGLLIAHTRMQGAAAKRPPPLELVRKA